MNRRKLLKYSFASLLAPKLIKASQRTEQTLKALKKNVVFVSVDLGLFERNFRAIGNSSNYYLEKFFSDFKEKSTSFNGIYEPNMGGGHEAEHATFTCIKYKNRHLYKEHPFISLDHYLADNSLQTTRQHLIYHQVFNGCNISWNRFEQAMPAIKGIDKLYGNLFGKTNLETELHQLRQNQAIYKILESNVKNNFTGNPTEKSLLLAADFQQQRLRLKEKWLKVEKPYVEKKIYKSSPLLNNSDQNFELIFQAIKLQQAQIFSIQFGGNGLIRGMKGIEHGYHTLSHHGYDKDRVKELTIVDEAIMASLATFLQKLENSKLLDDTIVLFHCGHADSNKHTNISAPAFLFGGGFNHKKVINSLDDKGRLKLSTSSLFNTIARQAGVRTGFAGHHHVIKDVL